MHFTKVSVALLGLVAIATASPFPDVKSGKAERGLSWVPRSLAGRNGQQDKDKKNDKNKVTIIDTTVVKLTEQSKNSEVELTILVEKKIKIEDQKKKAKDNVRKNHYRNKNKNVNTIIIVVTEIIDIRDSKNHNTRYMKHQLRADNKAREDVVIQVTEIKAITISNSDSDKNDHGHDKGSKTKGHGDGNLVGATAASAAAANAIQTVDPNAPFTASNQTTLLPSGAAAPSSQSVEFDPAAIVEDAVENVFVQVLS